MTKLSQFFERQTLVTFIAKIAILAICLLVCVLFVNYFIDKLQNKDSELVKERVDDLKRQITNSQTLADSFARSADEIALTRKSIQTQIQVIDNELVEAKARDEKIADSIRDVKNSYEAARYKPNIEIIRMTEKTTEANKNNAETFKKANSSRRGGTAVNGALRERERRALSTDRRLYPVNDEDANDDDDSTSNR